MSSNSIQTAVRGPQLSGLMPGTLDQIYCYCPATARPTEPGAALIPTDLLLLPCYLRPTGAALIPTDLLLLPCCRQTHWCCHATDIMPLPCYRQSHWCCPNPRCLVMLPCYHRSAPDNLNINRKARIFIIS
ncbi:hypothetical protein RRG08_047174 [Elysia crispata]|uniref:Uncharacterized protein n=1 Tax=Elysia crispata TaxID=231223 RepID=A0AAE0YN38_9GAST|nr:hypothetical protein RRG08_047174 [Elysia crispata]